MPVDGTDVLEEITQMLRAIRDDLDTDADITLDSTFRGDLGIESIDIVALAGRLQARYGGTVNFALFLAGLGVESVSDLRVGTLVEFIAGELAAAEAKAPGDLTVREALAPSDLTVRGAMSPGELAAAEAMAP